MQIREDEFVNNKDFEIVTGKHILVRLQHIARKNGKPLCGVKIVHDNRFDLFKHAYLCIACEVKYLELKAKKK